MHPNKFKSILEGLNISPAALARLTHYHPRTVRGWGQGRGEVPPLVADLLRMFEVYPESFDRFKHFAGPIGAHGISRPKKAV